MALYADALSPPPCPLCGSDRVRWRGRRPWDMVFTWLRYLFEVFASAIHTQSSTYDEVETAVRDRARDGPGAAADYREANTGWKTPKRFWRCPACKKKGSEFA